MDASSESDGSRRSSRKRGTLEPGPSSSTSSCSISTKKARNSIVKPVRTSTSSADDAADAEVLKPRHTVARHKHLQILRTEVKSIAQKVFAEFRVSGSNDEKLTRKIGLLLDCQPPRPWLFDDENGYDTDEQDDQSDVGAPVADSGESDEDETTYLFLDSSVICAAECGSVDRTRLDSRMEPDLVKILDSIAVDAARISSGDANPQRRSRSSRIRECDLKDYKFEATACLINDYLRCKEKSCIHSAPPRLSSQTQSTQSSSSKRRSHASSRRSQKRDKSSENVAPTSNVLDVNGQQFKLLSYIDTYDLGQNWWEPSVFEDYKKQLNTIRIYPRVAQSVFDLARSFGRLELQRDSEAPMLWEWGCEVKVKLWSLPDFQFFWSKLNLAGICGEPALHNFLLVLLEKKFLALNEALALYEHVARTSITPIVTMYVEREITNWQMRNDAELEWVLSTIDQNKSDEHVYSTALANSILLRVACKTNGEKILRHAISPDYDGPLKTYNDRYKRILSIAQSKARFTLDLSVAGVPSVNLLRILRDAANRANAMANNSDAGVPTSSSGASASITASSLSVAGVEIIGEELSVPHITFTFHLFRTNIEFAVELARSLNILTVLLPPTGKSAKIKGPGMTPEDTCATIDWQKVEIKRVSYDPVDAKSQQPPPYEGAREFRAMPFVYMPNEEQLLVRVFRRNMPLDHPMLSMVLHTLYDNDHANMTYADDAEAVEDSSSSYGSNFRPKLHFQLRLLADSVEALFGRVFAWQSRKVADSASGETDVETMGDSD